MNSICTRSIGAERKVGGVLAAAFLAAAGAQAAAEIIHFTNPTGAGHYNWAPPGTDATSNAAAGLDIKLDAGNQPGITTDSGSFTRSTFGIIWGATNDPNFGMFLSGDFDFGQLVVGGWMDAMVVGKTLGESIDATGMWNRGGNDWVHLPSLDPILDNYSLLPEGEQSYLAVRFDEGDGWRYGWIGVVRGNGLTPSHLDVFGWAYETEVGVAILAGAGDAPPCAADLNGDTNVDVFDLLAYLDLWFIADADAELTGDDPAMIDVFDLLAYLDGWFAGC